MSNVVTNDLQRLPVRRLVLASTSKDLQYLDGLATDNLRKEASN